MGTSGKGFITSLDINAIRKLKNVKKSKFAITEVSLKYLSKIVNEFKDVPYEGYVRKISKYMHTDSYFYIARNLAEFMMSKKSMSNSGGLVRTQNMSTQNMSNLRVCSMDESKSKIVHVNEIE